MWLAGAALARPGSFAKWPFTSGTQGFEVRFLTVGAEVRAEHFELLPSSGRLVVVVDDAHDRSDTRRSFARDRSEEPGCPRVACASDPTGSPCFAGDLRQVGLHPAEVPRWELDDLGPDDADALARQALGPVASEQFVRRLAHLTSDCPLITVVAGVLIQRGQLDATALIMRIRYAKRYSAPSEMYSSQIPSERTQRCVVRCWMPFSPSTLSIR